MSEKTNQTLTLTMLQEAVAGTAAAFRCIARLEPAGGPGDKIFPPTYEGGQYATEERRINGEVLPCVLLDSVQSQTNRMELALLDAWERKPIPLPVISVDFVSAGLTEVGEITSLEAPHRIADAILRDSRYEDRPFRQSSFGKKLNTMTPRNATALFELCPTALLFGLWDSTGPKGGAGAKFARAMVSEIIGINAQPGMKTSSRIDPLGIMLQAGPLYQARGGGWTLDPEEAIQEKNNPVKLGTDGKPSEANHGNVTPTIADGGFTIDRAIQTTVVSLPALRRLRFPINGKPEDHVDHAARTVLAALGLCAAALTREQGYDLRSRCQLHAMGPVAWEMIGGPGEPAVAFSLSGKQACELYREAVAAAKRVGLPWHDDKIPLQPSPQLVELVRRSRDLAAKVSSDGEGGD